MKTVKLIVVTLLLGNTILFGEDLSKMSVDELLSLRAAPKDQVEREALHKELTSRVGTMTEEQKQTFRLGKGYGKGIGKGVGNHVGKGVGNYVGKGVGKQVGKGVGNHVGKDVGKQVGKGVGKGLHKGVKADVVNNKY